MMASLTSTKDTSSRQDQWSRQGTAPDKMNGTDKTVTTWDEGNLAKTSSVCCWKVAVGGGRGEGAPLNWVSSSAPGRLPQTLCRAISSCCTLPRFKTRELTGKARLQHPGMEVGG